MTPAATHQKRAGDAFYCKHGHWGDWRYKKNGGGRVCRACERRAEAERSRRRRAATTRVEPVDEPTTQPIAPDGVERYSIEEWKRLFAAHVPPAGMIGTVRYPTEPEWCE